MRGLDHDYLERIAYRGSTEPNAATLIALHRAHLQAVPFENLDIHRGREIVLDEERILHKIVRERRGGFCYELNGAFAYVLRALGFRVTLLSARVATESGAFGPEYDHLLLRVDLDRPWLADVGFGDSFVDPLPLDREVHVQGSRAYRVDDELVLFQREVDWSPQYRFTLQPRAFEEFAGMCRFHQTSQDSHFTKKRVCTRATPEGRITLRDDRLIITEGTTRREEPVADHAAALEKWFGIR